MGTRYAVVKGVSSAHSAAMQTAVTNAGGTFIRHDLVSGNFDASFLTDANGATFAAAAIVIAAAYADVDWDVLQALRIQNRA